MIIEGCEVEIVPDLQNPAWRVIIDGRFAFVSCTNKRKLIHDLPAMIRKMKRENQVKARVNKDGLMGSASRVHKVKKGKGSFQRNPKHKKGLDN
jgi:stalled ribosome alternative rescue factor ArfA